MPQQPKTRDTHIPGTCTAHGVVYESIPIPRTKTGAAHTSHPLYRKAIYHRAVNTGLIVPKAPEPEPPPPPPELDARYGRVYRQARKNARQRNIAFELPIEDFEAIVRRAGDACELSGIRFQFKCPGYSRNPYGPSIDRIDSNRGYNSDNCRLICGALNVAMNVWGLDVILELVEGVRSKRA